MFSLVITSASATVYHIVKIDLTSSIVQIYVTCNCDDFNNLSFCTRNFKQRLMRDVQLSRKAQHNSKLEKSREIQKRRAAINLRIIHIYS